MRAGWVDEIAWCEASWSSKLSVGASHTMVLLLLGMMMLSLLMMLMLLNMFAASLVHLLGVRSLALMVMKSMSIVLLGEAFLVNTGWGIAIVCLLIGAIMLILSPGGRVGNFVIPPPVSSIDLHEALSFILADKRDNRI